MNNDKVDPQDKAVADELKGVPEEMLDSGSIGAGSHEAGQKGDSPDGAQSANDDAANDLAGDSGGDSASDLGSDLGNDSAQEALEQLRGELEESKQQVLYAKADTQNLRRRMEKDVTDARSYAATGFARDILSVADNLSRALDSMPQEMRGDEKLKGFIEGIEATQREIEKVFGQHGITRIAAMGLELDPNQHQAMIEIPSNDHAPGTIVQEMQSGYMIKDRLLRPAMVGVAKKPD